MTLAFAPRASSRRASGRFLATRAQLGVDTSEPMMAVNAAARRILPMS
jgi:hypothetical protein